MIQNLRLWFNSEFRFDSVVYSHGWSSLLPFFIEENPLQLTRDIRLSNNAIARVCIQNRSAKTPLITVESQRTLSTSNISRVKNALQTCLHLSSDLKPFYQHIKHNPTLSWAVKIKAGRMLRGETFFEDAVKTILTTNCSWSLTTSMNGNLMKRFGKTNAKGWNTFPTAESIAETSPEVLRTECKLGYRSDYVYELSAQCASGKLDIEAFRTSSASSSELFSELRNIKGIGDYAAANLLRLLGKFDYLGLDSWCRSKFSELHGNGNRVSDKEIERHYAGFEEWKGLAMWLELTRYWYSEKFPI